MREASEIRSVLLKKLNWIKKCTQLDWAASNEETPFEYQFEWWVGDHHLRMYLSKVAVDGDHELIIHEDDNLNIWVSAKHKARTEKDVRDAWEWLVT